MGSWGDDIYDSDSALDAQALLTNRLERELAYRLSPENVVSESWWLMEALIVIEIMLLLEQHEERSAVYIQNKSAVQRWREVILNVWDSDWRAKKESWETTTHRYSDPTNRQQDRPAIIAIFDRLDSLAQSWSNPSPRTIRIELTPIPPEYALPYFAKHYSGRFIGEVIYQLLQEIGFALTPEQHNLTRDFGIEEIWASADMLGFLCEVFHYSPGVNEGVIRKWRNIMFQMWKELVDENKANWEEVTSGKLYQNVIRAFDRLETVAQKHPPMFE